MDLLDLVKDKFEPGYLDGKSDAKEARVTKRVKIFDQQVKKGVAEMQVYK